MVSLTAAASFRPVPAALIRLTHPIRAAGTPVYRIGQELRHNTVKHAQAANVILRLATDPEALTLEVTDDRIRFDPHGSFPGHLGLRSSRARVRLGGRLTFDSTPARAPASAR